MGDVLSLYSDSEEKICLPAKNSDAAMYHCIRLVIRENASKGNTINIKAYLQVQEESASRVDLKNIFPPAEFCVHTQSCQGSAAFKKKW